MPELNRRPPAIGTPIVLELPLPPGDIAREWFSPRGDANGTRASTRDTRRAPAGRAPESVTMIPLVRAADVEEGEPPFLLSSIVHMGTLVMLFAPSNSYKSFVAMTLACSVASGEPFAEHATRQGPVVYVCAEGSARLLRRRAAAWCALHAHGLADLPLFFVPQAVSLAREPAVAALLARLDALANELGEPPALVIFDTLTASAGGANQNTDEIQAPLNAAREIARATGAAVALVHHTNKGKEEDRGWSGIRDAMDTIWKVAVDGSVVTAECDKERDLPFHRPLVFDVVQAEGSCALRTANADVAARLTKSERELIDCLADCHGLEARTATEWRKAAGLSERSFFRAKSRLQTLGYVDWTGTQSRPRFRLTQSGWRVHRASTARAANGLPTENWQLGEGLPIPLPLLEAGGVADTPAVRADPPESTRNPESRARTDSVEEDDSEWEAASDEPPW